MAFKCKWFKTWRLSKRLKLYRKNLICRKAKQSSPVTHYDGAWGERSYSSYSFFNSALDEDEWSASHPGRDLPRAKDPRYPLYRRLGGPQSRSGHYFIGTWGYFKQKYIADYYNLLSLPYRLKYLDDTKYHKLFSSTSLFCTLILTYIFTLVWYGCVYSTSWRPDGTGDPKMKTLRPTVVCYQPMCTDKLQQTSAKAATYFNLFPIIPIIYQLILRKE
jgi:hypothetical protein